MASDNRKARTVSMAVINEPNENRRFRAAVYMQIRCKHWGTTGKASHIGGWYESEERCATSIVAKREEGRQTVVQDDQWRCSVDHLFV
jgi:hypothetical protein